FEIAFPEQRKQPASLMTGEDCDGNDPCQPCGRLGYDCRERKRDVVRDQSAIKIVGVIDQKYIVAGRDGGSLRKSSYDQIGTVVGNNKEFVTNRQPGSGIH